MPSFFERNPVTLVVMGVCGSGKTTFGEQLGQRLDLRFIEGDALHPAVNIEKMSNGIALDDSDRWPWLDVIRLHCNQEIDQGKPVVVACSALKSAYRDALRNISGEVVFVHLTGAQSIIRQRMAERDDHFMPASLIDSQFAALESTEVEADVIELSMADSFERQLSALEKQYPDARANFHDAPHIALIGLGVMGGNLAANILDHGMQLQTCDIDAGLRATFSKSFPDIPCHAELATLVSSLHRPRCLFLLIKAGEPVDQVIGELLPLLEPDDVIIDLGNSQYKDTDRRCQRAAAQDIRYLGCGISGGAEGARFGPALMPGGDPRAWRLLRPFFEAIAAQHDATPCVTWIGPQGAGHFVKMVHNGIEYADMQLIAESYQLMRDALGMDTGQIAAVFDRWNKGPLASYLIEATAAIFTAREADGVPLINRILDKAGQKGTGGWTTEAALEYGVPATLITEAVFARVLSSQKQARQHYESHFSIVKVAPQAPTEEWVDQLEQALYAAKVISYVQGFMLMEEVSNQRNWQLDLQAIAGIWRAGCIIRGKLLDDIMQAFQSELAFSLLDAPVFTTVLKQQHNAMRNTIKLALDHGIPVPAYSGAIAFFDSIRSAQSAANLIQAQRDYFGAHTFERTDQPAGQMFHADWETLTK